MSRSFSGLELSKLWRGRWKTGRSARPICESTPMSRSLLAVGLALVACLGLVAGILTLSSGPKVNKPPEKQPAGPADLRAPTQTSPKEPDSSATSEPANVVDSDGTDDSSDITHNQDSSYSDGNDGIHDSAGIDVSADTTLNPGSSDTEDLDAAHDRDDIDIGGIHDNNYRVLLPLTDEELLAMEVNELGGVPIVMYHDIGDREGYLIRSRENFRKDLQRFYDLGYCLIPLSDYLSGNIRLPAGKSPLVITFDDGRPSQLKLIEVDGQLFPDPNCAVGILLDFSRKHPGFGHAATFLVNYPRVFGTEARSTEYLRFLLDNGMEIGNHTMNHKNLASTSPEDVIKEIGSVANGIRDALEYETQSLALPYGNYPKSKRFLLAGWWDDRHYHNLGVLLASSEPAPSPFSSEFNPLAIPRIHGTDAELDKWLHCLERYPERRYTSDGQDDTIAVCLDYDIDFTVERDWELDRQLNVRVFAPPVREPNTTPDAGPLKVRMFATPSPEPPAASNAGLLAAPKAHQAAPSDAGPDAAPDVERETPLDVGSAIRPAFPPNISPPPY